MAAGDRLRYALLTGGGCGLAPVAPGTFGTLPAVVGGVLLAYAFDGNALLAAVLGLAALLFAIGVAQTPFLRRRFGGADPDAELDPGAVVLDEIVGYLVALAVYLVLLGEPTAPGVVLLFAAFRVCDILKPPPIRRLEELPGAFGVMADDVLAGVYAGPLAALVATLLAVG